jgi:GDPmannose 4,6-dehydratase
LEAPAQSKTTRTCDDHASRGTDIMPNALITGITGQDGSYLAEFLVDRGYNVYGLVRRSSTPNDGRIRPLLDRSDRVRLISGDMLDSNSLVQALEMSEADEVYNLAGMSFVAASFKHPAMTGEHTAVSVARLLEAIRLVNPKIRIFQASSSEMFGLTKQSPQNEQTTFHPRSPYGIAKLYGHWLTVNFRESYDGVFACSGIMFNHESPRRGIEFVSRKITSGVARIKHGLQKRIVLGNLDSHRDWGYASEYVEAMYLMLNSPTNIPEDYVIATGVASSVRDFVRHAFLCVDIEDWERFIEVDHSLYRPAEVDHLVGDSSKAKKNLGWYPRTKFDALVKMMVESDLQLAALEQRSHF